MKLVKSVEKFLNERADFLATGVVTDFLTCFEDEWEEVNSSDFPIISPVEQMFWIEWQVSRHIGWINREDVDSHYELREQFQDEKTGKYRLDFSIDFFSGVVNSPGIEYTLHLKEIHELGYPLLGIEIDSHIWHEKTKEQARKDKERERYLVGRGWQLLRFTGSEVFNDAPKCVRETVEVADKVRGKYIRKVRKFVDELRKENDGSI